MVAEEHRPGRGCLSVEGGYHRGLETENLSFAKGAAWQKARNLGDCGIPTTNYYLPLIAIYYPHSADLAAEGWEISFEVLVGLHFGQNIGLHPRCFGEAEDLKLEDLGNSAPAGLDETDYFENHGRLGDSAVLARGKVL